MPFTLVKLSTKNGKVTPVVNINISRGEENTERSARKQLAKSVINPEIKDKISVIYKKYDQLKISNPSLSPIKPIFTKINKNSGLNDRRESSNSNIKMLNGFLSKVINQSMKGTNNKPKKI